MSATSLRFSADATPLAARMLFRACTSRSCAGRLCALERLFTLLDLMAKLRVHVLELPQRVVL
jgi:hypothetical protein